MTCVVNLFLVQVSTAQEIIRHFEGQTADLVVCDGAPDGENLTSGPVFVLSQVSCVFLLFLFSCQNLFCVVFL